MLRQAFALGLTLLVFLIIAVLPSAAQVNQKPFVSNVVSQQRPGIPGIKLVDILVDITYNVKMVHEDGSEVVDYDGDKLTISVAVSNDGGTTFTVPARTFSEDSDVWRGIDGLGIAPGEGKKIVWKAGEDVPDMFDPNNYSFQVKVTASDKGMVLIPAGKFQMGDTDALQEVYLDDFYMDAYEVTNAQYAEFLNQYGSNTDESGNKLLDIDSRYCRIEEVGGIYGAKSDYENHPVVEVSWYGAKAYAEFYGKRLPKQEEWEKAARGGLVGKEYPWGNDISHDDANYRGKGGTDVWNGSSPVRSFAPNGYGLYDMAGNVWEWCADTIGPSRVLRGGGWDDPASHLRVASRSYGDPSGPYYSFGFRCAGDVVTP